MRNAFSKWKLLALVAGLGIVADQAAKYWAVAQLTSALVEEKTFGQRVSAFIAQKNLSERAMAYSIPAKVTRFWQHRYTQNRGATWGGAAEKLRVPFFYLMSAAT